MNRTIGLIICGLLGVLDVAGIAGLWQHPAPPPGVAITGAALGIVTLAAYRPAKRGDVRATRVVLGSRVVSTLLGVPVFFVHSAPGWARAVVAVAITATVVAVTMLVSARRLATAARA